MSTLSVGSITGISSISANDYTFSNSISVGNSSVNSVINSSSIAIGGNTLSIGTAAYFVANGKIGFNTSDPNYSGNLDTILAISCKSGGTGLAVGYNNTQINYALNPLNNGAWVMYDHAANGGVGVWTNGIAQANGNVGIGINSPAAKLHVYNGVADPYIRISGNASVVPMDLVTTTSAGIINVLNANNLILRTNNTDRMLISGNGYVGIGTGTPLSKLHVEGNTSGAVQLYIKNTNGATNSSAELVFGNWSGSIPTGSSNPGPQAKISALNMDINTSATDLVFHTYNSTSGNIERMRINYNGNVGIGNTTPSTKLTVHSTAANASVGVMTLFGENGSDRYTGIDFRGVTSESWNKVAQITAQVTGGGTGGGAGISGDLIFKTNNANASDTVNEALRIKHNARVGIGTSDPGKRVEIAETDTSTTSTAGLKITNYSGTTDTRAGILFQSYDNMGCAIWSRRTGSYAGDLCFGTKPYAYGSIVEDGITERMRITGDGYVGIGVTSPSAKLNVRGGRTYLEAANEPYSLYVAYNSSTSGAFLGGTSTGGFQLSAAGGGAWVNVDPSGRVTIANQPVFHGVGRVGGDLNTGGESNYTIWVSSSALLNRGNCWNSSTGRFTCPVAGVYYVAAFFLCRANASHNITVYKNGVATSVRGRDISSSGEQNTGVIGYIDCSANDILDIRVSNSSGGDFYNDWNYIVFSLYG